MRFRQEGNGHGKVIIQVTDKGPGYVIICPEKIDVIAEGTPVFISRTVESWLADRPGARVRCALPIVQDGQTIAVHLWFDEVARRRLSLPRTRHDNALACGAAGPARRTRAVR